MKKVFSVFSVIYAVLLTGVFVVSAWQYYDAYIAWTDMNRIALLGGMMALSSLSVTILAVMNAKKRHGLLAVLIGGVVSILAFAAILGGAAYLINNVIYKETNNTMAMRLVYCLLALYYIILLCFLFTRIARRVSKHRVRFICFLLVNTLLFTAVFPLRRELPTSWLYPLYRLVFKQGGVETSDAAVKYDFAYSTEKTFPTDNLGSDKDGAIHLAKNEREGLQLFVAASEKGRSVKLTVSEFTDGRGGVMPVAVYREVYTKVPKYGSFFSDEFPDALVPVAPDEPVELEKNRIQPFYIETLSSAGTTPGEYFAEVSLQSGDGGELMSTTISARVYNVTMPDAPAMQTAMGLAGESFFTLNNTEACSYGWNGVGGGDMTDAQRALYAQYYEFLLQHHISPYVLPYDILDPRADAYMSDPRVTSFCIPYPGDDALLQQYYQKVASNPVWAQKGYFYPIDEPADREKYTSYMQITDRLASLCRGYNMVTPYYVDGMTIDGEKVSGTDLQRGRSSILCPQTVVLDEPGVLDKLYEARKETGGRLWWYVCCGPQGDYNNFFIRYDAIRHRVLFWQQKQFDVDGLLYWDTVYYEKGNPWETSKTWDSYESAGDGCLIYPGGYIGRNEPIATLRLKNICDGIEDYTLLTLAQAKLPAEDVNAQIAKITSSLTEYTQDDTVLEAVRDSFLSALAS